MKCLVISYRNQKGTDTYYVQLYPVLYTTLRVYMLSMLIKGFILRPRTSTVRGHSTPRHRRRRGSGASATAPKINPEGVWAQHALKEATEGQQPAPAPTTTAQKEEEEEENSR